MPTEFSSDSNLEFPDSKKRENKYHCSIDDCKESFRRQTHLDRHEYKHTGIVSRIEIF